MTRTAAHIEPPPGTHDTWDALVLTCACTVLEAVRSRPGRIATMTEDEYDTWRASVRIHRDAWRAHQLHTIEAAIRARLAAEAEADANAAAFEEQGRAAGWWMVHT